MKKKVIIWIVAGILVFLLAALVLFDLNKVDGTITYYNTKGKNKNSDKIKMCIRDRSLLMK